MAATAEPVILASASIARADLLRGAGVEFTVIPAAINEREIKETMRAEGDSALGCAGALAVAKASAVSRLHGEALVIGADQILAEGSEWYDKPESTLEASAQLSALRGRRHSLATAACVMRGGLVLWRSASEPVLEMRWFSDEFLHAYIAAEGESLLGSVGAYRLEGRGAQLFARIDGDYFTVLGLPLLELLEFLRGRGVIAT